MDMIIIQVCATKLWDIVIIYICHRKDGKTGTEM